MEQRSISRSVGIVKGKAERKKRRLVSAVGYNSLDGKCQWYREIGPRSPQLKVIIRRVVTVFSRSDSPARLWGSG